MTTTLTATPNDTTYDTAAATRADGPDAAHEGSRFEWAQVAPEAMRALFTLEKYVRGTGLDPALLELVRLRASYLNGCAYCIDMHTQDMRKAGETEQRLYAVPVWRETPFFTPPERAALAWAEAVTAVGQTGVPDDVYAQARRHFGERELVGLTMAVVAINGWNRMSVSFRAPVGTYTPA